MLWEATVTRLVEADDFFDAVDKIQKESDKDDVVIGVCPYIEEDEYTVD